MEIYLAAAAMCTKLTDFCRNAFDPGNRAPKWVWNLATFGFGIAVAVVANLAVLGTGTSAEILTGVAIGAAGSGFHELFSFLSAKGA